LHLVPEGGFDGVAARLDWLEEKPCRRDDVVPNAEDDHAAHQVR
jgi:hypothetical protein